MKSSLCLCLGTNLCKSPKSPPVIFHNRPNVPVNVPAAKKIATIFCRQQGLIFLQLSTVFLQLSIVFCRQPGKYFLNCQPGVYHLSQLKLVGTGKMLLSCLVEIYFGIYQETKYWRNRQIQEYKNFPLFDLVSKCGETACLTGPMTAMMERIGSRDPSVQ